MGKFEIYPSTDGYRWRLRAGNGEIIAVGEAYTRRKDATRSCEAVRDNAASAGVYHLHNNTDELDAPDLDAPDPALQEEDGSE